MPTPVTIPRLGWNMEEGTLVAWLKADGDTIVSGDLLFQLEGEKSVEDIESFDGGVLHIPADAPKPGDRVTVGGVIGYLLHPGEAAPTNDSPSEPEPVAATIPPAASPSVRRLARERGVDLTAIRATGRITAEDVERAAPVVTSGHAVTPRARRLAARNGIDCDSLQGSGKGGRVRERDVAAVVRPDSCQDSVPLTATRRAIAARMVESLRTTAPVTLTTSADATNLVNLRGQFKAVGDGPVPAYTDFLLKLAAFALQKHPAVASQWHDTGIRPASRIDIGLAVDADAGLLVPVVRDVLALGLRQVAVRTRELIDLARRGKLPARDMEGGCFTISSLGGYGVDAFTPIINPPQTAILGVGRIERRPAMDGDRVVGREAVTLSLTFDHRVIDGGPAARFLQTLSQLIATPGPWLST